MFQKSEVSIEHVLTMITDYLKYEVEINPTDLKEVFDKEAYLSSVNYGEHNITPRALLKVTVVNFTVSFIIISVNQPQL